MPGTIEEAGVAVSRVISICRDAEQGYRAAASGARDVFLKELFARYAKQHGEFASKLQEGVRELGYDPTDPVGLGGILYAGWVNLKGLVTSHDPHAILIEAERAEDWVMSTYCEALARNVPPAIRPMIQVQAVEVEKARDYLRRRCDATATKRQKVDY